MQRIVGVPCLLHLYNAQGRLFYPPDGVPDRRERERLWHAYTNFRRTTPATPENWRLEREARSWLLRNYGEASFISIPFSRLWEWVVRKPDGGVNWIAVIHIGDYANREQFTAAWVEVDPSTIPVARLASEALGGMSPDLVDAAAVIMPGTTTVWLRGDIAGDCERAAGGRAIPGGAESQPWSASVTWSWSNPPIGRAVVVGEVMNYAADLTGVPGVRVVAQRRLPWLVAASNKTIQCMLLLILAGAGMVVWRLTSVLVGVRRVRAGVGVQLFAAFACCAVLPLLGLVYVAALRLIDIERTESERWLERMRTEASLVDRGFRDSLEARQHSTELLARDLCRLDRAGITKQVAASLPADLDDAEILCFVDRRGEATVLRSAGKREAPGRRGAIPQMDQIGKVLAQMFDQLRSERGEKQAKDGGGKPEITIVDLVGEDSVIFELLRSFGRLNTFRLHSGQRFLAFNHVVESTAGRLMGNLIVLLDAVRLADLYMRPLVKNSTDQMVLLASGTLPDRPVLVGFSIGLAVQPLVFRQSGLTEAMDRSAAAGVAEQLRLTVAGHEFLVLTHPVSHLGTVRLGMAVPTALIHTAGRRLQLRLGVLLVLAVLLVWGGAVAIRALLVVPITHLEEGARAIGAGQFSVRLPILARDELGDLSAAFNDMAACLQERERLRRFISTAAFAAIRSGDVDAAGGRRVTVALLAADIRGFTTLSEAAAPEQVVAALNEYFSRMDSVITEHGGTVMKLVGDAILAMFEGREGEEHPVSRAVQAGLAMRGALQLLNAASRRAGGMVLENGVGVHFGEVVVGKVGSRHGRVDYSMLGAAVSEVQALEAASKLGRFSRVILSAAARDWCGDRLTVVPVLEVPDAFEVQE